MPDKPFLTVSEAIEISPVSRATFYKMLKNGDISKSKDVHGRTVIDFSELQRNFGNGLNRTGLDDNRQDLPGVVQALEKRIAELERQLDEMKDREIIYLQRENWLQGIIDERRLLEHKPSGIVQRIARMFR